MRSDANKECNNSLVRREFVVDKDACSVYFKQLMEVGGFFVSVTVKSAMTLSKSEAYLDVWNKDTLSWNRVVTVLGAAMRTRPELYRTECDKDAKQYGTFQADVVRMQSDAYRILGIN
jgi:hypothetical protein